MCVFSNELASFSFVSFSSKCFKMGTANTIDTPLIERSVAADSTKREFDK